MLETKNVSIPHEAIADFCRRNHILKMSLFGSVLRNDFPPHSDIDVLVEFEPGRTPGFGFVRIQRELSEMLERKVDLNTPGFLCHHIRDRVLSEAEVIYRSQLVKQPA